MDPARTARVAAAMKIWDLVEGIVVMVVVVYFACESMKCVEKLDSETG